MSNMTIHGGNAVTMTSLELVDYINNLESRHNLTHANFLAKVPKVIGDGGLIQFRDTYLQYKEANYTDEKTGQKCTKPYCHITPKGMAKLAMMFSGQMKEAA